MVKIFKGHAPVNFHGTSYSKMHRERIPRSLLRGKLAGSSEGSYP